MLQGDSGGPLVINVFDKARKTLQPEKDPSNW